MKTLRNLLFAVLLAAAPLSFTACSTPPSDRVVAVQTLKAVGHAAEGAVALSAQLYKDNKISAAKARQIADLYDDKFQPAFRAAVAAVKLDYSQPASPELVALAQQLLILATP